MVKIELILIQLKSEIMKETSIPNEYILIPEIVAAIKQYNWHIVVTCNPVWTKVVRRINYSS